jgi:hypothetical protein
MAEKLVKMTAITRVSLGEKKVAKPGEDFSIAESEVERLEKHGAAKRVAAAPASAPRKPPSKQTKATTADEGDDPGAGSGTADDQGDDDGEE